MKKRLAAGVLALVCLLLTAPYASAALDNTKLSTLTVYCANGDPIPGMHVTACKVADMTENGGIVYTALPEFAGANVDWNQLTTASFAKLNDLMIPMSETLDAYATANKIARVEKITDGNGNAVYTDLEPGLYLVAQTAGTASGYDMAPYLYQVPLPESRDDNGNYKWNYNILIEAKITPNDKPSFISVNVYKYWKNTYSHPDSVQVQLYENGKAYGPAVSLSDGNLWTYLWTGLSPDSVWTVDELNVPAGYNKSVTGDAKQGFIITNTKQNTPTTTPYVTTTPSGRLNKTTDLPKPTGDGSNAPLWIALIVVSLGALFAAFYALSYKRQLGGIRRK